MLEYNRSEGASAKLFFGGGKPSPPYERNEYGGNFAGPIILPGCNGRNRSFFVVAFEGFHLSQSASVNSQQPTALERQDIFTEFSTPVINPATGIAFSGQTIPTGNQNAVSLQLLKLLYPMPTASGTGTNTFELRLRFRHRPATTQSPAAPTARRSTMPTSQQVSQPMPPTAIRSTTCCVALDSRIGT